MKHIVIVTGGYLNLEFVQAYLKTLFYDRVFVVDKGLEYGKLLGLQPDYIVGDFDTVKAEILKSYEAEIANGNLPAYVERHPEKKDVADTELAILKAIEVGAECITIFGATGSRLDHVLANIGLLLQTAKVGIPCYIVDETNRLRLLDVQLETSCVIKREEQHGTYLSLIPLSEVVEGVTIQGVMYPLQEKTLHQGSSLTVSNQIIAEEAEIWIDKGKVLVIESRDTWKI